MGMILSYSDLQYLIEEYGNMRIVDVIRLEKRKRLLYANSQK